MPPSIRILLAFASLLTSAIGARATQATITAPGFVVTEIPTPDIPAGDVVVVAHSLFVGVGPAFVGEGQSIVRIDSSGTTVIAEGFNALSGMAYDPVNDRLLVGDNGAEASGAVTGDTVFGIPTPLGSFPSPVPAKGSELLDPGSLPGVQDLILDPSDPSGTTLLVTDAVRNEMLRVDLATASITPLQSTGTFFAAGLAASSTTVFFGASAFPPDGIVSSVSLPGSGTPDSLATNLAGQYDLELDAEGDVLSTSGPDLLRIDAVTGAQTSLATGFDFASGLFTQGDLIWVIDGGFPGVEFVYRLTVPEPEAGPLLSVTITLAGLAGARRRRGRSRPSARPTRLRRTYAGAGLTLAATLVIVDPAAAGRLRNRAIRIVDPLANSELTHMPLDIELDLDASGELQTLEVALNGTDVASDFVFDPPADGRVSGRTLEPVWDGLVLPGTNQLSVTYEVAGVRVSRQISFESVGDPYGDAVASFDPGPFGGFNEDALPDIATGPPRGGGLVQGGLDVVSLGLGGEIVIEFTDNVIRDGPGVDFTVFENAFMVENLSNFTLERSFAEPGYVSVSQDGRNWRSFACILYLDLAQGAQYPGCAGVYPVLSHADDPMTPHASIPTAGDAGDLIGVSSIPLPDPGGSGGDSYDLANVGLAWARYVRVRDANFPTGDPVGPTTAGFDLDAVVAVHSSPATDANCNGVPDAVK